MQEITNLTEEPVTVLVRQKDKPDYICNKICASFQRNPSRHFALISGLEGAIVKAVGMCIVYLSYRLMCLK